LWNDRLAGSGALQQRRTDGDDLLMSGLFRGECCERKAAMSMLAEIPDNPPTVDARRERIRK
jgi:hypothetical protein